MTIFDDRSLAERVSRFRETAIDDVYDPSTFIDWGEIDAKLLAFRPAVEHMRRALRRAGDSAALAAAIKDEPETLKLLYRLLSVPVGGAAFADGRELPERVPTDPEEIARLVSLLEEIGVWRVAPENDLDVMQALQVAFLAEEARRRGFRRRRTLNARINQVINDAAVEAQRRVDTSVQVANPRQFPEPLRSRLEAVILLNEEIAGGIATLFETYSGGRQQRELAVTLPSLQAEVGFPLIVIADGRAVHSAPDTALTRLFSSVADCMSIRQASEGQLADAIVAVATGQTGPTQLPIDALISRALESQEVVTAAELPLPDDEARLAIGSYFARHGSREALELTANGNGLRWTRGALVPHVTRLSGAFSAEEALSDLAELLTAEVTAVFEENGVVVASARLRREDAVLGSAVAVAAVADEPDEPLLHDIARIALQTVPEGHVAILVTPTPVPFVAPELQRVLPVSVIVIDAPHLARIARSTTSPRESVVDAVLAQSDLTKMSPFVLNAAAPPRIFFGREAEATTILTTLATSSVSLLGGRRIGKTSLLHRVRELLPTVGLTPFFGDCQTVRTWSDFARMARREWDVAAPDEFTPDDLFDLIEQLRNTSEGDPVLLLDEVDRLLKWDATHKTEVPEAFVRACRALSQQRKAQFVFSGERVISQRIWDAQSPHWNFARALMLRQLEREDAESLFIDPLMALRIQISGEAAVRDAVWKITSGHPQIVQFLGDRIVQRLNARSPDDRSLLEVEDVQAVAATYEFQEHFLETYWGQSNPLERLLSVLIGPDATRAGLQSALAERQIRVAGSDLQEALHMLELYGVVDRTSGGFSLRATFLPEALESYGGSDVVMDDFAGDLKALQ